MDLETAADHVISDQGKILLQILNDLQKLKLKLTIFSTAQSIIKFKDVLKNYIEDGHSIALHGYNHELSDNYKIKTYIEAFEDIRKCKNIIKKYLNYLPISFRGPFFSTSSQTQKAMERNNILFDFSVCSQRFDFLLSKGGDINWIISPRSIYHPSTNSPFRVGNRSLINIPLSSFILPFMSGTLYLFGLKFMKLFFRLLLFESLQTGKPIVYLFHSYEFTPLVNKRKIRNLSDIIHSIYLKDVKKRYKLNLELLKYILKFSCIDILTDNNLQGLL